jgi:hypothetical protein
MACPKADPAGAADRRVAAIENGTIDNRRLANCENHASALPKAVTASRRRKGLSGLKNWG